MFKFFVILLLLLILMSQCMGCVAVPGVVSAIAVPATESYSAFKTTTTIKSAVDVTLTLNDEKTTTDILLSSLMGKDCKIQDKFTKGKICEDKTSISGWQFNIPTADRSNETN